MLNNSQGSQGNNDLQTAQNAIAILIDQISKARGVGRTIVIDKNWLNNQLSALQNSLPAAVHQAQAVLKEKEATLSRAQQEAEMQRQTAADDAQRLKAQAEKESAILRADAVREQKIREADGEATAILKVQQAYADSLKMLNDAAPTDKVLTLKSFEALAKVADGQATKLIIPSEMQSLAGFAASIKEIVTDHAGAGTQE
mgnify:CR=1 FL=1